MKQILEFIPIALFALTYFKFGGVYPATGVLMAATAIQMAIVYAIDKKLAVMHKLTLALILFFGTLTLVYRDARFLQWKFTLLHGGFGLVLAVALFAFKKNLIKTLLNSQINLSEKIWKNLCLSWIFFFVFMATLNALIIVFFDVDTWTIFKIASIGIFLIFAIIQAIYISKHIPQEMK